MKKQLSQLKPGECFTLLDDADVKTYIFLGKGDVSKYKFKSTVSGIESEIDQDRRTLIINPWK